MFPSSSSSCCCCLSSSPSPSPFPHPPVPHFHPAILLVLYAPASSLLQQISPSRASSPTEAGSIMCVSLGRDGESLLEVLPQTVFGIPAPLLPVFPRFSPSRHTWVPSTYLHGGTYTTLHTTPCYLYPAQCHFRGHWPGSLAAWQPGMHGSMDRQCLLCAEAVASWWSVRMLVRGRANPSTHPTVHLAFFCFIFFTFFKFSSSSVTGHSAVLKIELWIRRIHPMLRRCGLVALLGRGWPQLLTQ